MVGAVEQIMKGEPADDRLEILAVGSLIITLPNTRAACVRMRAVCVYVQCQTESLRCEVVSGRVLENISQEEDNV